MNDTGDLLVVDKRYCNIITSTYNPTLHSDSSSGIMYEYHLDSFQRVEFRMKRHIVHAPLDPNLVEIIKSNFGILPQSYSASEIAHSIGYFRQIKWDKRFAFKYDRKFENESGWSELFHLNGPDEFYVPQYIDFGEVVIGKERINSYVDMHLTVSVDRDGALEYIHIYREWKKVVSIGVADFLQNMKSVLVLKDKTRLFTSYYYEIDIVAIHQYLYENGIINQRTREIDSNILIKAYRTVATTNNEFISDIFTFLKDYKTKSQLLEIDRALFRVEDLLALACRFELNQFFRKIILMPEEEDE
ncbi:predicted protein [Naegleria gruberi]|uniref:Predicted protein n=1 Tax=Naegleria gruberi TaxID=5762 RepID=D2W6V6_NAEGR|nr:uncharacterized protein NAEGRDRAFT_55043 [Naegleria gruberi]EFC35196.1 predicted protein [Naegleria gruberi]|eukprot:XP_002667940.1 predicted protein [Naegleria gruberi strain NEG-M]